MTATCHVKYLAEGDVVEQDSNDEAEDSHGQQDRPRHGEGGWVLVARVPVIRGRHDGQDEAGNECGDAQHEQARPEPFANLHNSGH